MDAFERKLLTILGESYTATSKNKRNELEKKVKELAKNTVRDMKKVSTILWLCFSCTNTLLSV